MLGNIKNPSPEMLPQHAFHGPDVMSTEPKIRSTNCTLEEAALGKV